MRRTLIPATLLSGLLLSLAGCQTQPLTPIAAPSVELQRVQTALAQWPAVPAGEPALKRPFFATIHIAGHRTTASGLLQFHNPRDFRITAATEMGVILFDARINWAGVTVLRAMPGIDSGIIESLISDIATAFNLPASFNGVQTSGAKVILKQKGADTNDYTWTFDARTGRLTQTDVDFGPFDTLHINYLRYNARGWPEELTLSRRARLYTIAFTFTDNAFAANTSVGSAH